MNIIQTIAQIAWLALTAIGAYQTFLLKQANEDRSDHSVGITKKYFHAQGNAWGATGWERLCRVSASAYTLSSLGFNHCYRWTVTAEYQAVGSV